VHYFAVCYILYIFAVTNPFFGIDWNYFEKIREKRNDNGVSIVL